MVEALVHDLRRLLRVIEDGAPEPRAARFDGRTRQASPERGARAGDDGSTWRMDRKGPLAVDTLSHVLALLVRPANEHERGHDLACGRTGAGGHGREGGGGLRGPGRTGEPAAEAAAGPGSRLEVVTLPAAKRGGGVLPRWWVVERSHAEMARFRRLARD